MNISNVTGAIDETVSILKRNTKHLATDFSVINGLIVFVSLIFIISILGVLFATGIPNMLSGQVDLGLIAIAVIFSVFLFIVFGIFNTALSATMYAAIDTRISGKKFSIIEKTKEYLLPMGAYYAIITLAEIVIFGLVLGTIILENWIIVAAVAALVIVFGIIAVFLTQFTVLEIALKKTSPIQAFSNSIKLTKKNWKEVIIYDGLVVVLSIGIGLVFQVITQIFSSVMAVAGAFNILFFGILLILIIIVSLIQMVVISLVTVPLAYFFWRRLK